MADILLPEPPEGYEYILKEKKKPLKEQLKEELSQKQKEQKEMGKPKEEDIIELFAPQHPYYILDREIEELKERIKEADK